MYSNFRTRTRLCTQIPVYGFLQQKILNLNMLVCIISYLAGQIAMFYGTYDLNLGSEILILGGDFRSRSWLHIGDSYGTWFHV